MKTLTRDSSPTFVAACVAALLLTGCTGKTSTGPSGEVEGSVTLGGKPLQAGSVIFSNPTTGTTDAAILNDSGKFTIETPLPVGEYQVSFEPLPPPQPTDEASGRKARAATPIHTGYQTAGTTDQVAQVKAGPNQFDFRLTKKGPKRKRAGNRP